MVLALNGLQYVTGPRSAPAPQAITDTVNAIMPKLRLLGGPGVINTIAGAMQGPQGGFSGGGGGGGAPAPANTNGAAGLSRLDIETALMLNPVPFLARYFPIHYLGGAVSNGVLSFTPQRNVVPLRLVIPRAQASGTVQSLSVALNPIHASSTPESAGAYAEDTFDSGWLPPIVCEVGQKVTAITNNVSSAGLIVADIDGMIAGPSSFLMRCAGSVTINAGASGTLTASPQKRMRLRRVICDVNGVAEIGASTCGDVLVGVDPQFDSADSLPIAMFDDRMAFGFIDGDLCTPGTSFSVPITNTGAAQHTYNFTFLGDAA